MSDRRIRASAVAIVGVLALLALERLAVARKPEPDDSGAARAFAKGSALFKQRDYDGAIEAFEEAYRLRPHFMVQCNIARCHEWSGNYVQAAARYRRCLKEGARGSETGDRAEEALNAVEARITWVQVECSKGGTIYIDGRQSGKAPGAVAINPGTRVVEVRRANATPASATIKTRGGEQRIVTLEPTDIAPKVIREPASQPVTPTPGKSRRVVHRAWFWTTAALTVALAAAATGMGIATLKARDSYEEHPTQDGCNTALSNRLATNVLWGLTAAAGAAGAVLFFYTDFSGERNRAGAAPITLSVGLRGTF